METKFITTVKRVATVTLTTIAVGLVFITANDATSNCINSSKVACIDIVNNPNDEIKQFVNVPPCEGNEFAIVKKLKITPQLEGKLLCNHAKITLGGWFYKGPYF